MRQQAKAEGVLRTPPSSWALTLFGWMLRPWREVMGLPSEVGAVLAAMLVNRAGALVVPFLSLYATRELGMSTGRAAMLLALYGGGSFVASPLAGWLSDRVGTAPLMKVSLFLSAGLVMLLPFLKEFGTLAAGATAFAITSEAFRPASLTHVGLVAGPHQQRTAFAASRLAINLGLSIGPAMGGLLAGWSFQALFFVNGIASALAGLLLVVRGRKSPATAPERTGSGQPRTKTRAWRDARLLVFLAAAFPAVVVFAQNESVLALFVVRDLHLPETIYGVLFTVNALLIVFIEIPVNVATNRWSQRTVLSLGALLIGLGFGVLLVGRGPAALIASVVIWTMGEILMFPAMAAYVAEAAPRGRGGEYMGAFMMAFNLAFAVGPWAGMSLLAHSSARTVWAAALGLGVVSAVAIARVARPPTNSPEAHLCRTEEE